MVVNNILHLMVAETKNNLIFVSQNIETQKRRSHPLTGSGGGETRNIETALAIET